MKKGFQVTATVFVVLILNLLIYTPAFAYNNQMEWKYVVDALRRMEGQWYDGNVRVVSIYGKYINGCEVLTAYDFAGETNSASGYFRIKEATGVRDIKIQWCINQSEDNDYIKINDGKKLYRK